MKKLLCLLLMLGTIVFCSCNSKNDPDDVEDGALKGKFSVSAGKQVQFSKGNLQYHASTQTWQFASKQYEFIGKDNKNIGKAYNGLIDLFGWGTGYDPTHSTEVESDYYDYVEWGYNAISNGGNKVKMWRTLEASEWAYIFTGRDNADILFGLGNIDGVKGVILLPDDWTLPEGAFFTPSTSKGLVYQNGVFKNSNLDNFSHNTYTGSQWKTMESAGAVFLPAAGIRTYDKEISDNGLAGYYWSSTWDGAYFAYFLNFDHESLTPNSVKYRICYGRSVRLVK